MEDLVILDFNNATVHLYKVDKDTNINDDYIEKLGFDTNECSWIFAEDVEVIKHKGILK